MHMTLLPRSQERILRLIYTNPGIRMNELVSRASVSVATATKRLAYLLAMNVITEERITGGKRVLLRMFYPDLESEEGRSVFALLESERRHEFLEGNPELTGPFAQLTRNLPDAVRIVLVFGSFADGSRTEGSDLDILFLTDGDVDRERLRKEVERSFATFPHEVSPRIDTIDMYRDKRGMGIYGAIRRNHVIITGCLSYVSEAIGVHDLVASV
jgi:hypothetical protein